jgi:hypothetical protein
MRRGIEMRALVVVGLAALLASAGCRVHAHANVSPPPRRTVVVQESVHYHDDHCGHCWDGSTWVYFGGHRHYRGCGHYYYGGRWCLQDDRPSRTVIVEDRRPTTVIVDDRHHCHDGCDHYHDGSRWVVIGGGHRHGRGCGHVFSGNRWTVSVRVR